MTTEESIKAPSDFATTPITAKKNDSPACPNNESNTKSDMNGKDAINETKAMEFKNEANDLFKANQYEQAIEKYTEAIKLNPKECTFYSNRSIAYFKIECYGSAVEDATSAIQINRNFLKGYYRRAVTYMAMARFKEALRDFDILIKTKPNDKFYRDKYNECNKIVKRIAFERAIEGNDNRSVADLINVDDMVVDESYTGPALEDGKKVTLEFIKELLKYFKDQKRLHRKYAYEIILQAQEIFKKAPTLVDINVPDGAKFTVCGDIHGQFYDLMTIFELNKLPSEDNPYLFNGDFVDRGSFSVECILTLFSLKILYPNHFFLARGNHESHSMNQMFGFADEVKDKYTGQMYELFSEVFNQLPLCHCINGRVLVTHGGLFSEDNVTLDDIRKINRFLQPPNTGLMCELLWSDPMVSCGRATSQRGIGCRFGPDVTHAFCKLNNLDYVIRSHEAMAKGYEVMHEGKCITVFSAPNYCDTMKNKGAFISLEAPSLEPSFITFSEVPHPPARSYLNNSIMQF